MSIPPSATGVRGWPEAQPGATFRPHVGWIDGVKALALLWIVLVHWTERVFGAPYFANPNNAWPPLSERVAQLDPLSGFGIWDWPLWILRLVGWIGDGGVQLFLIASGFGLTYGLLSQGRAPRWLSFYRRRFGRIYPMWIVAHLGLLAAALVLPNPNVRPTSVDWWLSLIGFRATTDVLYALCPAWWFVGLILQLYAVYPLLHGILTRLGWVRFAVVVIGASVVLRGVGLWLFAGSLADWNYLDAWSRGAIFVSRLPEFALGMALAAACSESPFSADRWLRSTPAITLAVALALGGFVLSFGLLGNAISPILFGVGAFLLAGALVARPIMSTTVGKLGLMWLARHSLSLFLTHQLAILLLVPDQPVFNRSMLVLTGAAAAATIASALALECAVRVIQRLLSAACSRWGEGTTWLRLATAAAVLYGSLLTAELLTRRIAPEEINGWGERPSLRPDPVFGWTFIPERTTRLRWQTYDYTVEANALGFPGPLYPVERSAGSLRVLTTGDAFTSAEGVNTSEAWPRRLEADLARRFPGRDIQVMNFAVTGYGPNQYAAVLDHFVPRFRPDVIVVSLFVNDLDDALTTTQAFRRSIGFNQPTPDGVLTILLLGNLFQKATIAIRGFLFETVLRRPDPSDSFLAMLPTFRIPEAEGASDEARVVVAEALGRIARIAADNDSRLIALLVPAGIQVCRPEQLPYFPRHVDLSDANRFDLQRPQRILSEITGSLGIETHDLRPVLEGVPGGCPYQPHNLHWLATGHAEVARFVAALIATGAE
jgi:Predicted acyltransferases